MAVLVGRAQVDSGWIAPVSFRSGDLHPSVVEETQKGKFPVEVTVFGKRLHGGKEMVRRGSRILVRGSQWSFDPKGEGWAQNVLKIGVLSLNLPDNCMILKKSWGLGPPWIGYWWLSGVNVKIPKWKVNLWTYIPELIIRCWSHRWKRKTVQKSITFALFATVWCVMEKSFKEIWMAERNEQRFFLLVHLCLFCRM